MSNDNSSNGMGTWEHAPSPWGIPAAAPEGLPPGAAEGPAWQAVPASPQPAPAAARRVVALNNRHALPAPSSAPAPAATGAVPMGLGPPPPAPPAMMAYPPRSGLQPPHQLGQEEVFDGHLLGASTLMMGAGSLLGAHFGGLYGGIAGALFAGSAINTLRAANYALKGPEQRREAVISGTYAALAAVMGGVILWKLDPKKKRYRGNPATKPVRQNTRRRACDIRPIGP